MRRVFTCTAAMALLATSAHAELVAGSPVFVVNLSEPKAGFAMVRVSTLDDALGTLPGSADTTTARAGLQRRPGASVDELLSSCKPTPDGKPMPMTPLVARLYDCVDCVAAYNETRFLTGRGDTALLIVLYNATLIPDSREIKAFFTEASRPSELVATARALAALLRQESAPTPQKACVAFSHLLTYKRSRLKVSVRAPASTDRGAAPATAPAPPPPADPLMVAPPAPTGTRTATAAAESTALESPEVVLGPAERWIVSADFSFSTASVGLGKDPTVPKESIKSKDFFVSLNYALADLLPDRVGVLQRRPLWQELVIKAQVVPSREPWSAWAVGVGVRGYRLRTILWNWDVAHPYVTVGRQRLDNGEARWRAAFGLGFDPRALQR